MKRKTKRKGRGKWVFLPLWTFQKYFCSWIWEVAQNNLNLHKLGAEVRELSDFPTPFPLLSYWYRTENPFGLLTRFDPFQGFTNYPILED